MVGIYVQVLPRSRLRELKVNTNSGCPGVFSVENVWYKIYHIIISYHGEFFLLTRSRRHFRIISPWIRMWHMLAFPRMATWRVPPNIFYFCARSPRSSEGKVAWRISRAWRIGGLIDGKIYFFFVIIKLIFMSCPILMSSRIRAAERDAHKITMCMLLQSLFVILLAFRASARTTNMRIFLTLSVVHTIHLLVLAWE